MATLWDNLRAMFSAGRKPAVPTEEEGGPQRWGPHRTITTSGIAQSLKPDRILRCLELADQGYPADLMELLHEVEDRDLHIVGVLGKRRRAATQLPWTVKPSDDSRRARKIAEWATAKLQEIENLEDGLVDLMDGAYKGYAIVELDWWQSPTDVGIRRMEARPQQWFLPDAKDPTRFRLLDARNGVDGVELTPWRFATHTPRAKSGFPTQAGLGRPVLWWYLFKNVAVQDWVTYGELFGSPLRVARYPRGTSGTDIGKLEAALQKLGSDSYAVFPDDVKIEFIKAGSSGSGGGGPEVFEKLAAFSNAEISKGILGETLTTEQGASGAKALGEVHNQVRMDLLRSDANQLSRTVSRDIVAPLVWAYFGTDATPPRMVIDTRPPEDQAAREQVRNRRAETFKRAKELGIEIPAAQVREELGIREATAGEELLGGPQPATPAPASVRAAMMMGAATTLSDDTYAKMADEVRAVADHFLADRGIGAWGELVREMRRAIGAAASSEEVTNTLLSLVEDLDLAPFADALADATLTSELVGRLQVQQGERPAGPDVPFIPPAEALQWWEARQVVTAAEFGKLSAEHRARAFTAAQFTSLTALQEVSNLLKRSLQEGGTFADFEDDMDSVFAAAGLEPKSPWRLSTIYYNATGAAHNVGRYARQAQMQDLRPFLRYHAVGDRKTRPTHMAMQGKVYPFAHPIWQTWYPPNGHRCRCGVTSHTLEEVRANGWIVEADLPAFDGAPLVPDAGFQRNPAREPYTYDFSGFPSDWREAIAA